MSSWNSHNPPPPPLERRDVPSLDYAIYLLNTVKFHLNQIFRFIDEASFTESIHVFYNNPAHTNLPALWHAQFLFVLAFGKAFLTNASRNPQTTPKGWVHASQAFAFLPRFHEPGHDNLLAIEVFCLAALYLQSIDMRVSAFEFVSQPLTPSVAVLLC